ncbi:MAG: hypothetical protein V4632_08900 [Pseudomonadota bacterium]
MKFNSGQRPEDLDDIYTSLCERLDQAGSEPASDFLARLCMLLIGEMDDKAAVLSLIGEAHSAKK